MFLLDYRGKPPLAHRNRHEERKEREIDGEKYEYFLGCFSEGGRTTGGTSLPFVDLYISPMASQGRQQSSWVLKSLELCWCSSGTIIHRVEKILEETSAVGYQCRKKHFSCI